MDTQMQICLSVYTQADSSSSLLLHVIANVGLNHFVLYFCFTDFMSCLDDYVVFFEFVCNHKIC